jgi:hypothetical protein
MYTKSSIPQSITLGMNKVGQNDLSIQPILIIFVEFLIISSVISFGFFVDYSYFIHSLNNYWIFAKWAWCLHLQVQILPEHSFENNPQPFDLYQHFPHKQKE